MSAPLASSVSSLSPGIRRVLVLGATALALTAVSATEAHAEYYFSKSQAESVAKDYISKRYANTYVSDLSTYCRAQGRSGSDPSYVYHRWVCVGRDARDGTVGRVLIVGSRGRGSYYGKVLNGFR